MALVAVVLSLCVAALGALGLLAPQRLVRIVRSFETPVGLYATAAVRLVFGAALVFAASGSRAPLTIWILGMVIFIAGLILPVVGLERLRRLMDWWLARGPVFARVWGAVALVFGLLLAYAVAP
jgi:hypothetical protein